MADMKTIKKQVKLFLEDPSRKKMVIDVPRDFKMRSLVNPIKLLFRHIIFFKQKWMVPSRFKNWYVRLAGVNIGDDVCLPHYIHFDPYFPELITIGKGSLVGGLGQFYTHELKDGKLTIGRIHVKQNVLTAGYSKMYPGVTLNEYVITASHSEIREDCPENSFVVGKGRVIKQWSEEDKERLFHKSKHDPNYYKKYKKMTKNLRKDPNKMVIKFLNDGKRLNPGNEWYLARPWPRIYYNALWVELARVTPWNWLRKLFWRFLGAKIGRNVFIGKGTVFDHIYGDKVVIGNNFRMGKDGYLDGHSYTMGETIYGRVKIGNNVNLGDNVHIMCGVTIGDNATVLGPASILKDIPEGETWKGIPAKPVEDKK